MFFTVPGKVLLTAPLQENLKDVLRSVFYVLRFRGSRQGFAGTSPAGMDKDQGRKGSNVELRT